jgi:hypothetical protein
VQWCAITHFKTPFFDELADQEIEAVTRIIMYAGLLGNNKSRRLSGADLSDLLRFEAAVLSSSGGSLAGLSYWRFHDWLVLGCHC